MAEDYYGGASENDSPAPEMPAEDKDKDMAETALLPKSIFGKKELEAGKKCQFEIVHVYEDEVEVKYVPHDGKNTEEKPDELGDPFAGKE